MSAIAGRVLLKPEGAYISSTTYHMLDVVSYNGNSYVAKQTTTGNTPSADNEYWMILASGSAVASISDIGDVLITDLADGQILKYNATTRKWENGQDTGGLLPHLIIISEDGESEVKAVKGSTEIIATRTSAGHYECDVPEFGTWTIHAVLNGDDATVNLVVDTVKVYTVDDSHFHADITVTYPSGGTCSCSKSGETTLYATGSPYTFTVHSAGTWTITAVANGKTFTQTVNISESGQTAYTTVPDGETVTPTDDIQILLACAGIGDSQITTLAELLDDTTTLSTVINSNNAVDYMVRSTTWAVAQALVPTMTSDTAPEGECICDSYLSGENAYKAFDRNNSTYWESTIIGTSGGQWVGYKFTSPQRINYLINRSSASATNYVKVQYSDDGVTWVDTGDTYSIINADGDKKVSVTSDAAHLYYRIYCTSASSNTRLATTELQFYSVSITDNATAMTYIGLNNYASNTLLADATWREAICNSEYFESVLNVKVPVMTDNTHPSGEASASSIYNSSYQAYQAFNGVDTTYWATPVTSAIDSTWVRYQFPYAVKIYKAISYIGDARTTQYKIQSSSDNITWVDRKTHSVTQNVEESVVLDTVTEATSYQFLYTGQSATNRSFNMIYANFYGREDV